MAYDKDQPRCIDTPVDILPYHIHMNGVAPVANTYGAIGTRLANEMRPVDLTSGSMSVGSAGRLGSIGNVTRGGQVALYTPSEKRRFSSEVQHVNNCPACLLAGLRFTETVGVMRIETHTPGVE
jgi:hypothetical protein